MCDSPLFTFTRSRINPISYKEITKKVRNLYKKNSPFGCSQNVKAEVRDIDKAVEANRLREKQIDEYAQSELKKLNLMKNKKFVQKCKTLCPQSPISLLPKPKTSPKPKTAEFKIRRRLSDPTNNQSPFRAASAVYSRQDKKKVRPDPLKRHRIEYLDSIMKSCDEFKPTLKPNLDEIENCQMELVNSANDVKEFIIDMEDCVNVANNDEKLREMMEECKKNRKNSRVAGVEQGIKDEMLSVTRKLVQFGGYKVWRHNHAEFMASAEKIINSIPNVRS